MFQPFEYTALYVDTAEVIDTSPGDSDSFDVIGFHGARIDRLLLTNDDTIAHDVQLTMWTGTAAGTIGSVAVPAGTGYAGVKAVDAIDALLPAGTPYLLVPPGGYVTLHCEVGVTTGKFVRGLAFGGHF